LIADFQAIADSRGVDIDVRVIGDTSPVVLPARLVDLIAAEASQQGVGYRVMPSGASHDTQQISKIMASGMIFVPSQCGLSHVPPECTCAEHLAQGTQVQLRSLIAIDGE